MTDESPLSQKELDELTAKAGVTSLSTQDIRRLLASSHRLRHLVVSSDAAAAEILQRLYDSEINGEIGWIWDAGFEWKLQVGPDSFGGNSTTVVRAIEDLAAAAVEHFPGSEFATWWKAR